MSCDFTDPPVCQSIVELIYSWHFFQDRDLYVLFHFLNPFFLYMISQNFWFSILSIYVWESIEVLELTACHGMACISGAGAPVPCASLNGFATDNLIGDISQGTIGILTGMLFRIVLAIPDWSPSFRNLYSTASEAVRIWFKRILFFFALFLGTVVSGAVFFKWYAHLVHAAYIAVMFVIFAFWNQTPSERLAFWTGRQFESTFYWTVYSVWALWSVAMVILIGYVPLGSAYQTFYLFIAITWLALLIASGFVGRFTEVMDFFTFGYLSIRTGVPEHRFLHDKKRFQNLTALSHKKLNNF